MYPYSYYPICYPEIPYARGPLPAAAIRGGAAAVDAAPPEVGMTVGGA